MKTFKFKINGNQYDVAVNDIVDNIANIEVNGVTYNVELEKSADASIKKPVLQAKTVSKPVNKPVSRPATNTASSTDKKVETATQTSSAGSYAIKSPLPGVILNILVKEGDKVSKGDTVLVMEAMKMENNIASDKDGVVSGIKVTKGQSILQNEVLVEIQ